MTTQQGQAILIASSVNSVALNFEFISLSVTIPSACLRIASMGMQTRIGQVLISKDSILTKSGMCLYEI